MKLKAVSGMMLTLLLIGMLTLAFNIQPVKAEPGTWTVDDDGSADFRIIQEATNVANPLETTHVHVGFYHELNNSDNPEPEFVPGEIILEFISNVSIEQSNSTVTTGIKSIDELNKRFEVTNVQGVMGNVCKLELPEDADVIFISKQYEADSNVEYAEPNYICHTFVVPNDADYTQQWAHQNIQSEPAWDIESGDPNVVIAVVDTGVDWDHPDLAANIWNNTDEIIDGTDTDNNGYIDDVRGYDFVDTAASVYPGEDGTVRDNDPMDFHGHGTHCSGIAAAVANNSIGVAGVSWSCKIMPVRAGYKDPAGYGSLEADDAALAIIYAADNGANIISMSWGDYFISDTIKTAIDYAYSKGVVLVAAAGNDNVNWKMYPAGFDNVIAVAATNSVDGKASWSNYGSWVDVSAPGVGIYSTVFNDAYTSWSGTSMSTPFVAGLAGLILSKNSTFTNEEVRNVLRSTTDPVTLSEYIGLGRINAHKALLRNSILIANLNSSLDDAIVRNITRINGTASGNNFQYYELYYGTGVYPTSWSQIGSTQYTPIVDDVLATWDTSLTIDGAHSIRLNVVDINGKVSEDRVIVTIDNIYVTSPQSDDVLRAGDNISINGTAKGTNFQNYTVEWGRGVSPTTWSSVGVILIDGGTSPIENNRLAVWNTISITVADYYTVKLTVNQNGLKNEDTVTIYLDPTLQEGWPQRINWDCYEEDGEIVCYHPGFVVPTVRDVNNDGVEEIIVVANGIPPKIFIWEPNGTLLTGWPQELPPWIEWLNGVAPTTGDIDNDGLDEIMVWTQGRGWPSVTFLFAFNHDGSLSRGWPVELNWAMTTSQSSLVLEDLDLDGNLEIIMIAGTINGMNVGILSNNGSLLSGWPIYLERYWGADHESTPAVGNLDADPEFEIVVAGPAPWAGYKWTTGVWNYSGIIHVFNINGSELEGWPKVINGVIFSSPAVGDVNNDGKSEIVVAAMEGDGGIYIFDRYGSILDGWPKLLGQSIWTSPALGDLDDDQDLEIVASKLGSPFQTYVWHHDGRIAAGWPKWTMWNDYYSPIIGDIDGDREPDIVTTAGQRVYAWHFNGTGVNGFPKVTEVDAQASATISDIDRDGDVEIIASSNRDYDWEKRSYKRRSSIYVWDLDGAYDPQSMEWPTFHHDEHRTGRYPTPSEYTLTIFSSPTGVTFTVDGVSHTTPWSETYDEETFVSLVMPEFHSVGDARYYWNQWSDGNTSRSRTVTMNTNITLTAHYTGRYYQLTVASSPITGIPFTINGVPQTTPYTEWLLEGSYTLIMPETHDGYVWSHWLEDGDTNRIKTILLQGTTWTAVYTPAPPPPVGGKATPINIPTNKPETPTLWIWLSTIILPLIATAVFLKHKKKKQ